MMDLYFFIIDFPLTKGVISWKGFSAAPAAFVSSWHEINELPNKARIFLLVDLRDFFFRIRVGGTKKK